MTKAGAKISRILGLRDLKGSAAISVSANFDFNNFLLWTTCSFNCNVVPSFLLTFKATVKIHVKKCVDSVPCSNFRT